MKRELESARIKDARRRSLCSKIFTVQAKDGIGPPRES